ncbi:hypothetical protein DXG01_005740 [Tephrocybe rancida]|nr:hypothetical protein DXG01_005740 [Tephrocybe rancida]
MTGTGLATLNLSPLTTFQQMLLYVLMLLGTTTTTSWLMILVRRYYILTECTDAFWKKKQKEWALLVGSKTQKQVLAATISSPRDARPLWQPPGIELVRPTPSPSRGATITFAEKSAKADEVEAPTYFENQQVTSSPKSLEADLPPTANSPNIGWEDPMSSIEDPSADPNNLRQRRRGFSFLAPAHPGAPVRGRTVVSLGANPFSSHVEGIDAKYQGEGLGLPGFFQIVRKATKLVAPKAYLKIERSMTVQTTIPVELGIGRPIIAGRNSNFKTESLTDEQLEEVGGLEYRAVTFLCFLIPLYLIAIQFITFFIFGPWLFATKEYDGVFEAQPRLVSKPCALEWFSFGILNLGLPVLKELPIASRVIVGLFQGIAVRASGLTIIVLSNIAPALQYEEKSLGIFEAPEGDLQENLEELEVREGVGRYVGWHLRQQMAVDIWWLVWGIIVIAITERGNIMNQEKLFLSLFTVTFELVSAFAGIGLSFGFPTDNYSLVGKMRKLSKLVVIIIMIRGRHRGLPVAVDRAVLLPKEYAKDTPSSAKKDSLGVSVMAAPTAHTV